MRRRVLVFNGLRELQPRGISRYTLELGEVLQRLSFDVVEIVIPGWLFRGPRGWKILVMMAYQQLATPLYALWYRPTLVVDPYNGYSVATALVLPTVAVLHDFIPFRRPYWFLRPGSVYQRVLHHLAAVLPRLHVAFVSEEVASESSAFLRKSPTHLLPNVIRPLPRAGDAAWERSGPGRACAQARERGDLILTTISGDGAHKDFDGLVRLLASTGARITLLAFGFDADAPPRAHGDVTVARFGPCAPELIGRGIADASFFLFHSLREGFGRPVCEALAAGKPVVTAQVPALGALSDAARQAVFAYSSPAEFATMFERARRFEGPVAADVFRTPPERYYAELLARLVGDDRSRRAEAR